MSPEQLKLIGFGFLAFADERAGWLQRTAIANARAKLDTIYANDLFAWFTQRGYLPASLQGESSMDITQAKALAQSHGVDTALPGWLAKLITLVQMVLDLFAQPGPMQAKPGCDDQHAACCECVRASAQALLAALRCMECCSDGC